ncbi:MAG: hypothetical protein ABIV94_01545 [Acidimicrobiales bacterium]
MADRRRLRDRGSVLMLVPAGVLVLVMLAGMTFDFAHVYVAQRELADLAESVANDVATYAVDQPALRREGRVAFDQDRADQIVALAASVPPSGVRITGLSATIDPDSGAVVVTATAEVDPVFLRAIPGEAVPRTVHATAQATLTR